MDAADFGGMRMSKTWSWGLALLALVIAPLRATAAPPTPTPVTVFAAASLKNSLDAVDAAYSLRTGAVVHAAYAASSILARQIEQGAPAQVFVSADTDWMDYLAKRGLIRSGTRRDLLTNDLALIGLASSPIHLHIAPGFPLAQALGSGRLAMAGPEVPAGLYGRQALTALKVWPQVQSKVVYGDNVRAALAFVAQGEAPLGVVYSTDARIDHRVRIVGLFPASSHPRILYPVASTQTAQGRQVDAYLAFLEGPQAAAIFRRYGFTPLGR